MRIVISIAKMSKYLRRNLGVPFIILFQLLILISAFIVIYDKERHLIYNAEIIAIQAFYLLTIGAVLQLYSFLRYPEDNNSNEKTN